jgi:type I restriction enzyme S subunit
MKTIFGVVPGAWHKSRIDEICRLSSGSTPRRDNAGNFNGNILWVTSGELKAKFVHDTKEKVSQLATKESRLELYEPGTVVVAIYGLEAIGIRGTASIIEKRCTISQACMAFSGFRGVDNEFFYYWYLHNGPLIGIRFAQGTKQQNLSSEIIGSLTICFPPLAEQRKIAKILAAQDKVIELKEKRLAEKQRQKKYLMQQLLTGKKRLKGFNGEWINYRLNQITKRIKCKNEEANDNVLTISAQHGLINQTDFFNKEIASADKRNYYLLRRDDFAYNKSYSSGYPFGAIKRLTRYDVGIVSPLYICFQISVKEVSLEYIEQYFEAGFINREIQACAQEGARNHGLLNIAIDDFFNIKIVLPYYKEELVIAKILKSKDSEIDLLRQDIE